MVSNTVSRDKLLEGYFDKVSEDYREAVRALTLEMSIDIMRSTIQCSPDEWETHQMIHSTNPNYVEIRKGHNRLFGDGLDIKTYYVSFDFIGEAYARVARLFSDLGIPISGKGHLRYYNPSEISEAKGGRRIRVEDDPLFDGSHIWPQVD